ncbi:MAG: septum formation initiator family protein [Treponema sp.]|nr:septum formation initiator family protein [Treponema sp.]
MNRAKYLLVIFLGTLVYVSLSMTVGQNGIKCYKQMEEQKRIVYKQKTEIQKINNELEMERSALASDSAMIAAYARKLDYVRDGEKLVKINGLKPAQTTLYDTGTVFFHSDVEFVSEKFCKISALIISLLTFVIMFILDVRNGNISFRKEKNKMIAGIPVYDLPQV